MGKQSTDAPIRSAGVVGTARRKGGSGNGGYPLRTGLATSTPSQDGGSSGSRTGSYDRRGRVIPAEGRALTSGALSTKARKGRLAMSLEKPEKIRSLQRKLYCKAKAEPACRFYLAALRQDSSRGHPSARL